MEVHAVDNHLYVYRHEVVRRILDADLEFYRPNGEDDLAAIARASQAGNNGELLGYGARNYFEPQGARVTITNTEGFVQRYSLFPNVRRRHTGLRSEPPTSWHGLGGQSTS